MHHALQPFPLPQVAVFKLQHPALMHRLRDHLKAFKSASSGANGRNESAAPRFSSEYLLPVIKLAGQFLKRHAQRFLERHALYCAIACPPQAAQTFPLRSSPPPAGIQIPHGRNTRVSVRRLSIGAPCRSHVLMSRFTGPIRHFQIPRHGHRVGILPAPYPLVDALHPVQRRAAVLLRQLAFRRHRASMKIQTATLVIPHSPAVPAPYFAISVANSAASIPTERNIFKKVWSPLVQTAKTMASAISIYKVCNPDRT